MKLYLQNLLKHKALYLMCLHQMVMELMINFKLLVLTTPKIIVLKYIIGGEEKCMKVQTL